MSVQWPFGAADAQAPTYAAALTATITNRKTFLTLALTGALALTIVTGSDIVAGAELIIKASSDGTARDITLTGALPATMAGVISKTRVQKFVYNGSSWIAEGAIVTLD